MKPRFTDKSRYPHGYRSSVATDIRETIERERRRIKAEQDATEARKREIEEEQSRVVAKATIKRRTGI